ncbi:hypothetical protein [Bdellovibrio sp. HCB337]|uniref:hypothetical protein n=1 Tax=Bdellovibrio sp. HCB337 TaxID=3394358 RepID=UPI0039A4489D
MRSMMGFFFAVVLIAFGLWFAPSPSMSPTSKSNSGKFIDSKKYPEITYAADTECIDSTGVLPPAVTVSSDFDGDGLPDRVRIAQKDSTHQVLVVWLSSKGNKPIELDQIEVPGRMSISIAKAGEVIQSACERGYMECAEGDPREIKLQQDGFWYVLCGSAASVFYWNPTKSSLDRMWHSD